MLGTLHEHALMPRHPRIDLPGIAQHIVQRGNNRQACFAQHEDYCMYVQQLGEAAVRYGCEIHAYVLMTNHVHLLATPAERGALSYMMQAIGRRYVGRFNARYRRTGTLWEGRYKAALVGTERYALACYRYIELNPVRARLAAVPSDHFWSSYGHNALGLQQPLLTPHRAYVALANTDSLRRERYRALVAERLDPETINNIREYTQQQRVYGSDAFRREIEAMTERAAEVRPRGRPRTHRGHSEK